ncbi:hypothetical protein JCM8115_003679 [Rhodotorula mucilaginosa]|uniref:Putative phospholipase n=1 Tax=Rhodotorula mucilaginosa TaxID=5537 RepID=A0A9P6W3U3_RHOMI|nr:hypothetical protein C6P46_003826 [Rhodotorula mucilaginosa]
MGLLIKPLPRYSGPHAVSTLDLELPIERPRSFGHATFKSTGQPALQLDTVLVTLYYPADQNRSGSGHRQPWVERPLNQTAAGYARFANQRPWLMKALVWLFARDVRLPVEAERPLEASAAPTGATIGDAPSRNSQSTAVDEIAALPATKTRIPVVIFSHGLSGTRTTYSQWCGEIASRGYLVAAIEHRDGSGPISSVRRADGTQERAVDYIRPEHLSWPEGKQPLTSLEFRAVQLEMRLAEVTETLRLLERLHSGEGADVARMNRRRSRDSQAEEWLPAWRDRLDLTEDITMAGHSFGGATAIQVLRAGATAFPFRRGIALDPWADPIPPAPSLTTEGADLARTNSNPAPTVNKAGEEGPPLDIVAPLLVINSESFTLWKEHYVLVRDIVNAVKHGADRWLMTMIGSIHTSFSDMPLLAPFIARRTGARVESKLAMDQFVEACHEFLRGDSKGQILGEEVRDGDEAGARPGEGEREADRKKRRPMEGTPGSMRMHVRP